LPLVRGGDFAKGLEQGRKAALDFHLRLSADSRFVTAFAPELDIVIFAPRSDSVTESSIISRRIFDAAAAKNLHLAVAELPIAFFKTHLRAMKRDRATLSCLRSVLMKPEHLEWMPRIWSILQDATNQVLQSS
jgi:tyrosine decarboxylase/aspartate 1-decarboxylase